MKPTKKDVEVQRPPMALLLPFGPKTARRFRLKAACGNYATIICTSDVVSGLPALDLLMLIF
jgi:hypothetical protein